MRNRRTANTLALGSYHRRVWLAWLSAMAFGRGPTCARPQNLPANTGMELRLDLSKQQHEVGEPFTFRVEFQNRGNREVKIGFARDAIGRKLSLRLKFTDDSGNELLPRFSVHLSPYGPETKRDLVVALDPGHFYGWEVSLSSSDYSFLDKPGLYQAQAFYEYHAPNEGVQPNHSQATGKERSALFSGTLRSEPVRVTVVPHSP
jgi:hypothetical protein